MLLYFILFYYSLSLAVVCSYIPHGIKRIYSVDSGAGPRVNFREKCMCLHKLFCHSGWTGYPVLLSLRILWHLKWVLPVIATCICCSAWLLVLPWCCGFCGWDRLPLPGSCAIPPDIICFWGRCAAWWWGDLSVFGGRNRDVCSSISRSRAIPRTDARHSPCNLHWMGVAGVQGGIGGHAACIADTHLFWALLKANHTLVVKSF